MRSGSFVIVDGPEHAERTIGRERRRQPVFEPKRLLDGQVQPRGIGIRHCGNRLLGGTSSRCVNGNLAQHREWNRRNNKAAAELTAVHATHDAASTVQVDAGHVTLPTDSIAQRSGHFLR